jgi:hypothetical protein
LDLNDKEFQMATASLFIQKLAGVIGMELAQEFNTILITPATMSNQLRRAFSAYVTPDRAINIQNFITSRTTMPEPVEEGLTQMCGREWFITLAACSSGASA